VGVVEVAAFGFVGNGVAGGSGDGLLEPGSIFLVLSSLEEDYFVEEPAGVDEVSLIYVKMSARSGMGA
jgi:hypothetical protein